MHGDNWPGVDVYRRHLAPRLPRSDILRIGVNRLIVKLELIESNGIERRGHPSIFGEDRRPSGRMISVIAARAARKASFVVPDHLPVNEGPHKNGFILQ